MQYPHVLTFCICVIKQHFLNLIFSKSLYSLLWHTTLDGVLDAQYDRLPLTMVPNSILHKSKLLPYTPLDLILEEILLMFNSTFSILPYFMILWRFFWRLRFSVESTPVEIKALISKWTAYCSASFYTYFVFYWTTSLLSKLECNNIY